MIVLLLLMLLVLLVLKLVAELWLESEQTVSLFPLQRFTPSLLQTLSAGALGRVVRRLLSENLVQESGRVNLFLVHALVVIVRGIVLVLVMQVVLVVIVHLPLVVVVSAGEAVPLPGLGPRSAPAFRGGRFVRQLEPHRLLLLNVQPVGRLLLLARGHRRSVVVSAGRDVAAAPVAVAAAAACRNVGPAAAAAEAALLLEETSLAARATSAGIQVSGLEPGQLIYQQGLSGQVGPSCERGGLLLVDGPVPGVGRHLGPD